MPCRVLVVIVLVSLTWCQTVQIVPQGSDFLLKNPSHDLLSGCSLIREVSSSGQYTGRFVLQYTNAQTPLSMFPQLKSPSTYLELTLQAGVYTECQFRLGTTTNQIYQTTRNILASSQAETLQIPLKEFTEDIAQLSAINSLQILLVPQANGRVQITELTLVQTKSAIPKSITHFIPKLTIDLFHEETDPIFLVVEGSVPLVANLSSSDNYALGGGRKLFLVVESGADNDFLTTEVSGNMWSTSSPQSCTGYTTVVYDALSEGSLVNPTGLGCVDLTDSASNSIALDASSTDPTRFKLTIFSGENQSTYSWSVDSTQTSYLVMFEDLIGNANLQCVGAIQLITAVPSFGEVRVSSILVGGYHPTPSATPSPTPSKSYMVLSGPTLLPPPPHPGQCVFNSDCDRFETVCTMSSCEAGMCQNAPRPVPGCCTVASDCPVQHECTSTCVESYCIYENCNSDSVHVQPNPPANQVPGNDDQASSYGWIIGLVVGVVGVAVCVVVVMFVCVASVHLYRKRRNPQQIYHEMLGGLQ